MPSLDGNVALVAGGAAGNRAALSALADAGATLVIQCQNPAETASANELAPSLGGRAEVLSQPVNSFADAEQLINGIVAKHGTVDVLLTPVIPSGGPGLTSLDEATWAGFKADYISRAVALARAATATMATQPGAGRVVVIGSATTFLAPGVAQGAANAAMLSLTSAASAGLRETAVRVNGLLLGHPGANQGGIPAPSGADGAVDVVGAAVVWLASTESEGVNGKFVYAGGSDIGFYTMPMLMENANVQVRFDGGADAAAIGAMLNNLTEIGKVQRQA